MNANDMLILIIKDALISAAKAHGVDVTKTDIEVPSSLLPPDPKMGDAGFAMFALSKVFHTSPAVIAKEAASILMDMDSTKMKECGAQEFLAVGPYLNVRLDRKGVAYSVLQSVMQSGSDYGKGSLYGKDENACRIMVEFSCPNTNKPLHLGHLRNDALGESLSRILSFAGANVKKVDLINDRGVHICKSMLSYKMNHEDKGDTPESLGIKGDHFVGLCYIEYAKAEKDDPALASKAEEMLLKWEAGDEDVRALWQTMNKWTIDGIEETYRRTGVSFDKVYYESQTYLLGKDEVNRGLKDGVFFKAQDGSVRCDITEAVGKTRDGKAQEKVLLRSDGTSVYITQDIGTAIMRHKEWPYNKMIYVVASEQAYHFKALFYILRQLGYDWAENLVHLSYGLVNLPEGRMKSREGTVVDADDLIDRLKADAMEAMASRLSSPDGAGGAMDAEYVAEKVALGALHYYLLCVAPNKDMLFDPKQSLSFVGDTGPYLQYMCARITSILRKAKDEDAEGMRTKTCKDAAKYLTGDTEWALIKAIAMWPEAVKKAAVSCDPSVVALWLKGCAKAFSKFYDECPILQAETEVKSARLLLAQVTLTVMKSAMELILVPYLERM